MVTPRLSDGQHVSVCFLYNVVLENYSVQNFPWGGGGLLAAHCLVGEGIQILQKTGYHWRARQ